MNDFGLHDALCGITNPAIKRAREIYKNIREKRMLRTMDSNEMTDEQIIKSRIDKWPAILYCATCHHAGILKKYHKKTMSHKVYHTRSKGKPTIIVHHFCKYHSKFNT